MDVDSAEGVIEQVDVGVLVDCTRKRNASLLPAREVDAFFPNLCLVAAWENLEVGRESTHLNHLGVPDDSSTG